MKRSTTVQRAHQAPLMTPRYEDGSEDTLAYVEPVEVATANDTMMPEDFSPHATPSTESDLPTRLPTPHVKTVSVQYGRKLNLGDYNSAEISITVWADLDEDEDVQGALDTLYQQAKENVKKQALPLLKSEPASLNYRETFLGTPVEAQRKEKGS